MVWARFSGETSMVGFLAWGAIFTAFAGPLVAGFIRALKRQTPTLPHELAWFYVAGFVLVIASITLQRYQRRQRR